MKFYKLYLTISLYKGKGFFGFCKTMSCYTCFTPAKHCCQNCQKAKYCGKKCQILDWNVHKHECFAKRKHEDSEEKAKRPKLDDEQLKAKAKELFSQMHAIEFAYNAWSRAKFDKDDEDDEDEDDDIGKKKALLDSSVAQFRNLLEELGDNATNTKLKSAFSISLFERAVYTRISDIVIALLQKKIEPAENVLIIAVQQRLLKITRLLLAGHEFSQETKRDALRIAIRQFDADMAFFLVKNGAKEDGSGANPLSAQEFIETYVKPGEPVLKQLILDSMTQDALDRWFFYYILKMRKVSPEALGYARIFLLHGADINTKKSEYGQTILHRTADMRNGAEIVEFLLDAGADVEAKDVEGETPLYRAVARKRAGLVKLLISKGADVNAVDNDGQTMLYRAVVDNSVEIAKLLLTAKANVILSNDDKENSLLNTAVTYNYTEMVRLLLQNGADANTKNEYGETPLYQAVKEDNVELVKLLIEKADLEEKNEDGETALHRAVDLKNDELVELLLAAGAEVNSVDKQGKTVLMFASRLHFGNFRAIHNIVKLLLAAKASVNAVSESGETALSMAVERSNVELVKLLLASKATVNVRDNEGVTPLHLAALISDVEIVEILLKNGADVNAVDESGETPLTIARNGYNSQVVEILLEHGAKE